MMKTRHIIDKFISHSLVVIMTLMVINVLWQVFSRYVLASPSPFTDELARYLMIWLGILGAAFVSGKNMHVAITILPEKFSTKTQEKIRLAVRLLIIGFCLFAMVIGGSRLVYITYVLEQYSPALRLPLALVYVIIPISGLLIIYYKTLEIIKNQ